MRHAGKGWRSAGTGTAISPREVLTVWHLTRRSGASVTITPSDRQPRRGTVHCADERADLAHVILDRGQKPLPHSTAVPGAPVRVSDGVVAFGRTSGLREARFFVGRYSGKNLFSLNIESHSGDSGGGVFTRTGKLVGVVSAKRKGESIGTKRTGIFAFLRRCRPSKVPVPEPPPPVQGPPGPPGADGKDGKDGEPGTSADMSRVEALEQLVAEMRATIEAQQAELNRLKNLRVGIDLTKPDNTTKRLKSGKLGDAENGVFVRLDVKELE